MQGSAHLLVKKGPGSSGSCQASRASQINTRVLGIQGRCPQTRVVEESDGDQTKGDSKRENEETNYCI